MEIVVTNTHPPLTSCQTLVQALHKQYRISSQPKPCGRCSHPHAAEAEAGVVYSFSRATPLVNVSISYSPHTGLHLSGFPKRIHRPFPISSFPYTESHNTGLTVSPNVISPIKNSQGLERRFPHIGLQGELFPVQSSPIQHHWQREDSSGSSKICWSIISNRGTPIPFAVLPLP